MVLRRLLKATQTYLERVRDPAPPAQQVLYKFESAADLARWRTFSDQELGGKSVVEIKDWPDHPVRAPRSYYLVLGFRSYGTTFRLRSTSHLVAMIRERDSEKGAAQFCGHFSTEIADDDTRMQRSGFCGIHTLAEGEGDYIDLSEHDTVSFRVFGDGRKYIANFRTENWIVGSRNHDVWQAFLFARKGMWTDVDIPLERFLLTWKGRLVERRMELNPERIISLGVSLAGGEQLQPEGNFRLGLHSVSAKRDE